MAGAQRSAGALPPPGLPSLGFGHSALPPSASIEATAAAAAALETQLQPRHTLPSGPPQGLAMGAAPSPSQPHQPSQAGLTVGTVAAAPATMGPARANGPVPSVAPPTVSAAVSALPAVVPASTSLPSQPPAPDANAPMQGNVPGAVVSSAAPPARDLAEAAAHVTPPVAEAAMVAEERSAAAAAVDADETATVTVAAAVAAAGLSAVTGVALLPGRHDTVLGSPEASGTIRGAEVYSCRGGGDVSRAAVHERHAARFRRQGAGPTDARAAGGPVAAG